MSKENNAIRAPAPGEEPGPYGAVYKDPHAQIGQGSPHAPLSLTTGAPLLYESPD